MSIPEVRIFVDADSGVAYTVIKGPHGWYGAPGLRKGQFLTDADVADAIPLQPGPAVVVDIHYNPADSDAQHAEGNATYDVDVNGNRGPRRVSHFIAGAFIVAAALQKKDETVMVRALPKVNPLVALTKTPLSVVPGNG